MIKKLLLILLVIAAPAGVFAQDIERVKVQGEIHVPKGEDAEGISVYNASSQKGTITDSDGSFEIEVAENDRLRIFALQYQPFTAVVDKGIVERKQLNIYVYQAVTELDEVVVRPYDLSGNIRADIEKIPTYYVDRDWDMSYATMEFGYGFVPDSQSSIKGIVAEKTLNPNYLQNGVDVIAIMGGVASLLFPKKEKMTKSRKVAESSSLSNNLQRRFSREFVVDNFGISKNKAFDFLYYVEDEGLDNRMLKLENELQLMEFLHEKSEAYKKLSE